MESIERDDMERLMALDSEHPRAERGYTRVSSSNQRHFNGEFSIESRETNWNDSHSYTSNREENRSLIARPSSRNEALLRTVARLGRRSLYPVQNQMSLLSETLLGRARPPTASVHPSFRTKAVCTLNCKFCCRNICDRGMKAILLADTRVIPIDKGGIV